MYDVDLSKNENGDQVLIIGATNRPDSLDPALRRAGRFDREISLGIPNLECRAQILKVLTKDLKLSDDFSYEQIAKHTPGYVGADLMSLTREAAMAAVNRVFNELKLKKTVEVPKPAAPIEPVVADETCTIVDEKTDEALNKSSESDPVIDPGKEEVPPVANEVGSTSGTIVIIDDDVKKGEQETAPVETPEVVVPKTPLEQLLDWLHNDSPLTQTELDDLHITMQDFAHALKCVQPSAKREGFATVPDVTWDDVGSLRDIREELQLTILVSSF